MTLLFVGMFSATLAVALIIALVLDGAIKAYVNRKYGDNK